MATVLSYWIQFGVACYYAITYCTKTLQLTTTTFTVKDAKIFGIIAIPAMLMYCIEWWVFESSTIFVGYGTEESLAAQIAVQNTFLTVEMISIGISTATATIVGNLIGEGKIEQAKRIGFSAALLSMIACTVVNTNIWLFQDQYISFFTQDITVYQIIISLLPIYIANSFADSMGDILLGVITGLGEQRTIAFGNLFAYNIIGLSTMYYYQESVVGIWTGLLLASVSAM